MFQDICIAVVAAMIQLFPYRIYQASYKAESHDLFVINKDNQLSPCQEQVTAPHGKGLINFIVYVGAIGSS